jgi:hypothetical protein
MFSVEIYSNSNFKLAVQVATLMFLIRNGRVSYLDVFGLRVFDLNLFFLKSIFDLILLD